MNKKGFTMLEMLLAMGIFLLLIFGIVELLLWGNHGKDVVWEQLSTQNEGRKVAEDFINNLRRASQSSIGAYPLAKADSQEIIFYSNIDTDSWVEQVRFFLQNKILKKGIIKPSGTPLIYNIANETTVDLVHDVANTSTPIFYYYDENYTGVSGTPMTYPVNISAVRIIGIKLLLDEKPNVTPAPLNVEAKTTIRNLKSN